MKPQEIKQLIDQLKLIPHPEGGYFRETYRSTGFISKENLSPHYSDKRNYSTAIYFLLSSGKFSAFHRIIQDEIWHFYRGTAIKIHILHPSDGYESVILGNRLELSELPQFVVPGGSYFAVELVEENSFALCGCTVSPGFDFADFEMPSAEELLRQFPDKERLIRRLTRH